MQTLGRPVKDRSYVGEPRSLTQADIDGLERAKVPAFQKFRDSYWRVARMLALGFRNDEVAYACGYSVGRILQLQADTTFQANLAKLRQEVSDETKVQIDEYMFYEAASRNIAARRLYDRLCDEDEP